MRTMVVVGVSLVVLGAGVSARQGAAGQVTAQGPTMAQGRGTPPPLATPAAEVKVMFDALKTNLSKSAELFPEDKYEWSPTPDVRTWGGLFLHIIDDNNGACWVLAGDEKRPASLDAGGKPTDAGKGLKKADIVKLLGESFARCDKAFAAVTPENMLERATPTATRSKLGTLIYDTQHISEHYGNAVTYLRLQNIVPPSTAARMGRGGF